MKRTTATADTFTSEELAELNRPRTREEVAASRRDLVDCCRQFAPELVGEAERLLEEVS